MILYLSWRKPRMSFEEELNKIIEAFKHRGIKIKLYGSVGIKTFSSLHARKTFDIDFLALSKNLQEITEIFKSLNYRISESKRRTDLVFFKKEPIKIKVDIELDSFKIFEKNLKLDLVDIIELEGFTLPPHFLFITKLCAPLDEDNTYDLAYLLAENPFEPNDLLYILNNPNLNLQFLLEKMSNLPALIIKNKKIEKSIQIKANKFLKVIKRILNL